MNKDNFYNWVKDHRRGLNVAATAAWVLAIIFALLLLNEVKDDEQLSFLLKVVILLACAVPIVLAAYFRNKLAAKHGGNDGETAMDAQEQADGQPTAWELTKQILVRMNCQFHANEDDKQVVFQYQGANFVSYTISDWMMSIGFLGWKEISLDDLDAVATMQRVINQVNSSVAFATPFYIIDNNENSMLVSAKCPIVLIHNIPHIDDYYAMALKSLFDIAHTVDAKYQEERIKEHKEA